MNQTENVYKNCDLNTSLFLYRVVFQHTRLSSKEFRILLESLRPKEHPEVKGCKFDNSI